MPGENYTHAGTSSCGQRHGTPFDYSSTFPDLAADADLHVIDKQCRALRLAQLFNCRWNGQPMKLFHFAIVSML